MAKSRVTTDLPDAEYTEPAPHPSSVDPVPTTDKHHNHKEERHEIKLIKQYTNKHVHSLNTLAQAFGEYMSDLSSLQKETFVVVPDSVEE